jgi:Spx/MgsR family transcriptional regulator
MQITVYGIKNCDTMKKAFTWLESNGIDYAFHDYKKAGIDENQIKAWLKLVPLEGLINSKGITYKKLNEEEKQQLTQPDTAIPLMITHTSMIKRPIVTYNDKLLLGFDEKSWGQSLK